MTTAIRLGLIGSMLVLFGCNQDTDKQQNQNTQEKEVYTTVSDPNAKPEPKPEPAAGEFLVSGIVQIEQPCGINTQGSRIKCPSYQMVATSITVVNKDTQKEQIIESNKSGDFSISLPSGTYILTAKKQPMMKGAQIEIAVTDKAIEKLKLTYKPAIQPR